MSSSRTDKRLSAHCLWSASRCARKLHLDTHCECVLVLVFCSTQKQEEIGPKHSATRYPAPCRLEGILVDRSVIPPPPAAQQWAGKRLPRWHSPRRLQPHTSKTEDVHSSSRNWASSESLYLPLLSSTRDVALRLLVPNRIDSRRSTIAIHLHCKLH